MLFLILIKGGIMICDASITFAEIFEFIGKNILWFAIPIDIIIITVLIIVIVRYRKNKKKKGGKKKRERKRQN